MIIWIYGFISKNIIKNGTKEVFNCKDSVSFGIITNDNKLILGKQFRPSLNKDMVNLFGGYIEKGEDNIIALERELYEETNLTIDDTYDIIPIYDNLYVSPGYSTEKSSLYLVITNKNLNDLKLKCNDEDENIKFTIMNLSDIKNFTLPKESGVRLFTFIQYIMKQEILRGII